MATSETRRESDVDEDLRSCMGDILHHPPSIQLLAYVREHDGRAVVTPKTMEDWMTRGQLRYAFEKLEEANLISKDYDESARYGARDPPKVAELTDRGERFFDVAKEEGYSTNLWKRAEVVHEAQRDTVLVQQELQRLEEKVDRAVDAHPDYLAERVAEIEDHLVELDDWLDDWTDVAEETLRQHHEVIEELRDGE